MQTMKKLNVSSAHLKTIFALIAPSLLTCIWPQAAHAGTSVSYTQQQIDYPTAFTDNGGVYNPNGTQLGMWAHGGGNKQSVVWRTFKTAGDNTGSARTLQVGDVFTIGVSATRAYGQIGFSLNAGGTQSGSWANRQSGSRLNFNLDGNNGSWGSWYVNANASPGGVSPAFISSTATYSAGLQGTYQDFYFNVRITSATTADAWLVGPPSSTTYRAYNLTMNGTANIDTLAVYLTDDWDGGANKDIFWEQPAGVTNSGIVQLGYFLASGNFTPGLISDGLDAGSTSTTSANSVFVGGNAGSAVVLNQANTFTGPVTVNAAATAQLQNNTGFGSASGGTVTVAAGGRIQVSGSITVGSGKALTLNSDGISASGSLENTSGTNVWSGPLTLGSAVRINSDTNLLTLNSATAITSAQALTFGGSGNVRVDSAINTGANSLTKDGSGILTLTAANSYSGGTVINAGTLSISSDGNLGNTSGGVSISGGFNSVLAISSSLTLNSGRTINIGSTGGKLDAGANTLTIAGPITNTSGNNHLFILANGDTALNGNATGTGDIVKQGTGTLTLNGSANTFGTTAANIYIDNGVVQGASSAAFGQTSSSGGALTMGADDSINNGGTTLLLTSAGASVANIINVRHYAAFNAAKTIGGGNTSGTVTFSGNITLNDSVNLTAASGGTAAFTGVIQQGTAGGTPIVQDVNGTPGIVKVGFGTVTLTGVNTFSGTTTVSNGTLVLNGTNGTGALTVATNGTLNGNGLIKGPTTVQLGGTLAPSGTFPATLTVSNTLALSGNGNFRIGTGQTADKITGVSTFTSGGTLNVALNSGSLTGGEVFTLVQATSYSGSAPAAGTLPSLSSGQNWYLGKLPVNGTIAVNRAPTAQNISLGAQAGVLQTLPIITSTKHAPSDADSDTLTVSVVTKGTNSGAVAISGGSVTYSNNAAGADSFTYTVSDGRGGFATNTVTVNVTAVVNQVTAQLSFNGGGNAVLVFWGVPGTSYTIQKSSNLSTWSDLTTVTANNTQPYGRISFTDTGAANGTAGYYRLKP